MFRRSRRLRRRALVAAAVLTLAMFFVLLAACPARADEVEVPDDASAGVWYGWQTLATDGAAFVFALGVAPGMGSATGAAAAAYGLGGPLVHLIHDRPEAAVASVALRLGLPATGYLVGAELDRHDVGMRGGGTWAPLLAFAGVPAAIAVDCAVLARAPQPEPEGRYVQHLTPSFAPRKEGGFDVARRGAF